MQALYPKRFPDSKRFGELFLRKVKRLMIPLIWKLPNGCTAWGFWVQRRKAGPRLDHPAGLTRQHPRQAARQGPRAGIPTRRSVRQAGRPDGWQGWQGGGSVSRPNAGRVRTGYACAGASKPTPHPPRGVVILLSQLRAPQTSDTT